MVLSTYNVKKRKNQKWPPQKQKKQQQNGDVDSTCIRGIAESQTM